MKSIKNLLMVSVGCCCLGIILPASAQTWTQTSAPGTNWTAIASSADGSTLVALNHDVIYVSTNSGITWQSATNAPILSSALWESVSSSANGSKLVAAAWWVTYGPPGNGGIFISTNSGIGWT